MDLRRIGDVLLRSRASPLLPFLTPSVPLAAWFSSSGHFQLLGAKASASSNRRRFVSSTSTSQASSPAAALHPEEDEDKPHLEPSNDIPNPTFQLPASTDRPEYADKLMNESMSGRTPATAHSRTSRFKSTSAQADNRGGTSADDVKDAYEVFSTSLERRRANSPFDASKMNTPKYGFSSQSVSQDVSSDLMKRTIPLPPRLVRLSPSVGRSVEVDPAKGMGLAQAFTKLDITVSMNGVRRDVARQRFHERPGLKKKRLKSERWGRRFKDGFRALVDKVDTMRRQGW
ncbi:MAG: hypothetical protein FRX48_01172 [Lasallia pustulata]|uniref:Ribosomal protein S21 n=1 Tax=Lasallia pustulata TaxID=136370 RepID=A0A1W5CS65_9LECA|nr:MAG: hypothetical protein FRX48_01172 [Lasallia pustulata]SLM33688.1 Ribosomal protein S21 [Lasallia pustulata]